MEPIRLATEVEIKAIESYSDLSSATCVIAFGEGESLITAVFRNAFEVDPVNFGPKTSDQKKLLFQWGMENALRLQGVKQYYFNVKANDETWRKALEHYGAIVMSPEPEIRYKRLL